MSESQAIEFGAIITISMPEGEGQTHFHVLLASSDLIINEDGHMKPLGDCTLAELQQFADNYEAELWSHHKASTLFDLVVEGQATISVVSAKDKEEEAAPKELTLEHLIVFPPGKSPLKTKAISDPETSQDLEDDLTNALEEIDGGVAQNDEEPMAEITAKVLDTDTEVENIVDSASEEIFPEAPVEELDSELLLDELARVTDDPTLPEVSVEKTEPIFKEREAEERVEEEVAEVAAKRKLFRILGKRRPLSHRTWTAVDILISERAFRAAQVHADSSLDREVAGILIGPHPEKQPDGRYVVHVSDAIIAKHTRMQGASVTYTPESWRYVNDKLAEMYPDNEAVIVGWYHTHPGFGIFLSGMDKFIHQNFFTQLWHIAMVLDPLARQSGFFCWDRGLSGVDKYEFPWPVWASGSW